MRCASSSPRRAWPAGGASPATDGRELVRRLAAGQRALRAGILEIGAAAAAGQNRVLVGSGAAELLGGTFPCSGEIRGAEIRAQQLRPTETRSAQVRTPEFAAVEGGIAEVTLSH